MKRLYRYRYVSYVFLIGSNMIAGFISGLLHPSTQTRGALLGLALGLATVVIDVLSGKRLQKHEPPSSRTVLIVSLVIGLLVGGFLTIAKTSQVAKGEMDFGLPQVTGWPFLVICVAYVVLFHWAYHLRFRFQSAPRSKTHAMIFLVGIFPGIARAFLSLPTGRMNDVIGLAIFTVLLGVVPFAAGWCITTDLFDPASSYDRWALGEDQPFNAAQQ